jgi:hypothetical protein
MNLLTLFNSQYLPFAKIFFNSLLKLDDYNKIDKIYVINTGLSEGDLDIIKNISSKVVFLESKTTKYDQVKLHSKEWVSLVSNKVHVFLDLINKGVAPLLLVDIDSYFRENFLHLLNFENDIVVCGRAKQVRNKYKYKLTHISSFFAVRNNSEPVKLFLESWVDEMLKIKGHPVMDPALSELMRTHQFDFEITTVKDDLFSLTTRKPDINKFNKCKIFHMKSDVGRLTIESRIQNLLDYDQL